MITVPSFLKVIVFLLISSTLFISCKRDVKQDYILEEINIDKERTLDEAVEGTWYLMSYYLFRVIDNDTMLLDSPKIEVSTPIASSYIHFPLSGDIEFKTPRGRSLYRDWQVKDSIIYAGCSNNIPKDCNFGNTHALLRGAFKVSYIDEEKMELICTSNYVPGSQTIEVVQLLKKHQ